LSGDHETFTAIFQEQFKFVVLKRVLKSALPDRNASTVQLKSFSVLFCAFVAAQRAMAGEPQQAIEGVNPHDHPYTCCVADDSLDLDRLKGLLTQHLESLRNDYSCDDIDLTLSGDSTTTSFLNSLNGDNCSSNTTTFLKSYIAIIDQLLEKESAAHLLDHDFQNSFIAEYGWKFLTVFCSHLALTPSNKRFVCNVWLLTKLMMNEDCFYATLHSSTSSAGLVHLPHREQNIFTQSEESFALTMWEVIMLLDNGHHGWAASFLYDGNVMYPDGNGEVFERGDLKMAVFEKAVEDIVAAISRIFESIDFESVEFKAYCNQLSKEVTTKRKELSSAKHIQVRGTIIYSSCLLLLICFICFRNRHLLE